MDELKQHIQAREAVLARLRWDVIQKQAHLLGLPRLDICTLREPSVQYCRLSDPKREGKSLKKKQCDLWEFCWGAGALLAFIISQVDVFTEQRTLELGGGIGLASLAILSKYDVKRCVMTDLVPDALRVFELSAQLNAQRTAETLVLNWNREEDYAGLEHGFDIVLGSDVLFMSWCAPLVAKICAKCLQASGVVMILDPFRLNDALFVEKLREEGVLFARSFVFSEDLIARVAAPLRDELGSFVPVKRAKLIIASRSDLDQQHPLLQALNRIPGLAEE